MKWLSKFVTWLFGVDPDQDHLDWWGDILGVEQSELKKYHAVHRW